MNKAQIEALIEKAISGYFSDKPDGLNHQNYHILNEVFPKQRQTRALIGGLETSFGKRLWQPLAAKIAEDNGFTVIPAKEFNKKFGLKRLSREAKDCLRDWEEKRSENIKAQKFSQFVSLNSYYRDIKAVARRNGANLRWGTIGKGEAVNLWLKKGNNNYIYNISTNKLNTGGGVKANANLMKWHLYAAFYSPAENFQFQYAFPFNPYPEEDFWLHEKNKISPMKPGRDAVVENEFWDFLSGKRNTWKKINDAFVSLGPSFGNRFSRKFG